jgi:DNA uptake protein ComE-like DNA-binding protein
MRGGLKLAERGVIPRLLSGVFRRGKKIVKDTNGETSVNVSLSYYEIYNDKVFDLLEPPENRTPSGLSLREKDGKTIVVGLSERSCQDLKDFETLYIEANNNRVTAATKLNAHSSRSHAILRVTVTQTTGDMVLSSTASAIDLAGSEDNRRTDNGKERLVESAAINKSLFVLSQCIDAISRADKRIPYRESKMTRILSLGQNNGITIMILNLAPMRSYHLDTLSSLNVSSRAKRIEVREIENEVVYKMPPRANSGVMGGRQPLRALTNAHNVHTGLAAREKAAAAAAAPGDKPVKAFSVYTDRSAKPPARAAISQPPTTAQPRRSTSTLAKKRPSDPSLSGAERPSKLARPSHISLARAPAQPETITIPVDQLDAIVERKISEMLATRAAQQQPPVVEPSAPSEPSQASLEMARRLEALERRIESKSAGGTGGGDAANSEGLRLLLRAQQAKARGDEEGALSCYESALPFFPGQAKLLGKIEKLRERIAARQAGAALSSSNGAEDGVRRKASKKDRRPVAESDADPSFHGSDAEYADEESFVVEKPRRQRKPASSAHKQQSAASILPPGGGYDCDAPYPPTPRTRQLLDVVNSRDEARIRALHGIGAKKARDLVDFLELKGDGDEIHSLGQLRMVPGMGGRAVERAYEGLVA